MSAAEWTDQRPTAGTVISATPIYDQLCAEHRAAAREAADDPTLPTEDTELIDRPEVENGAPA